MALQNLFGDILQVDVSGGPLQSSLVAVLLVLLVGWAVSRRRTRVGPRHQGSVRNLRRSERYRIQLRVHFSGDVIEGEGVTHNIGADGCRIRGDLELTPGLSLTLRFSVAPRETPIVVDRAIVRWAMGHDFGVEFINIDSVQAHRLRTVTTAAPSPVAASERQRGI